MRSDHLGHPRGQSIIIAKPQFVGGHRVVLIDHGNGALAHQGIQRVTGIEPTPPHLSILWCQQGLRRDQAVSVERRRPQTNQNGLTRGCSGLLLRKRSAIPPWPKRQPLAAQRHSA